MNIKKAKNQIKNAIIAYSTVDRHGQVCVPIEKQRPVFLVGAPGIGKTAIISQIADELDVAFVSYSMTHHTRQSALGLPFITENTYGEQVYKVSEYTMSEIIASLYDEMKKTNKKKGILFLDEINCVSETLAPSMLQFLQYKTFGRHQIPDGWIVVTAGNPPEYNNSVKEFDIAMLDRLKKIEVEPDFEVWKEFAIQTNVHPVVISYLTIKPHYFYSITSTVDGMEFVTARSWDDLSQMISLYEKNNLEVDIDLIVQYIQDEKISKDFSNYYDLYMKYKSDYQVSSILEGNCNIEIKERARNAKFDERLSFISLVLSKLDDEINPFMHFSKSLKEVLKLMQGGEDIPVYLHEKIQEYKDLSLKTDTKMNKDKALDICELLQELQNNYEINQNNDCIKEELKKRIVELKTRNQYLQNILENTFTFFEEVFGSNQEMLILVTELSINKMTSQYIYEYGCPKYKQHNKNLLFKDKENELEKRIEDLNLLSI